MTVRLQYFSLLCIAASEYCTGERFEAVCSGNQVLVIEKAVYGREKQDRCVTSEQGLNCTEDVIMQLDRKCSGKQTCQVVVGPADIALKRACHTELRKSLDVQYSCTKGWNYIFHTRCPSV